MIEELAKHTRGRWMQLPLGDFGSVNIVSDSDGQPIAFTGTSGRTRAENEANAEFIVRAVSSHYALIKACERLLANLDDIGPIHKGSDDDEIYARQIITYAKMAQL